MLVPNGHRAPKRIWASEFCVQLEHCDLVRDRQRLAYQSVREHHAFASSRNARASKDLYGVLRKKPSFFVGN